MREKARNVGGREEKERGKTNNMYFIVFYTVVSNLCLKFCVHLS